MNLKNHGMLMNVTKYNIHWTVEYLQAKLVRRGKFEIFSYTILNINNQLGKHATIRLREESQGNFCKMRK